MSDTIEINPSTLKWLIDTSGFETEELAQEMNLKSEQLAQMQSSVHKVKIKDLKKMAKILKRPLVVFFLPEPPKEIPLTDFRRTEEKNKLSKNTQMAIRLARFVQSSASQLLEEQNMNARPQIKNVKLSDDPEKIALDERKKFGLKCKYTTRETRILDGGIRIIYNNLRKAIEDKNIFVLQSSMPIDEVRGFTLGGSPKIILINSKDDVKAKIFTLVHEYAHILLDKNGICLPNPENLIGNHSQNIEKWCNAFASAFLMPKYEFVKEFQAHKEKNVQKILDILSKKFKANKKATAIRILKLVLDKKRKKEYAKYFKPVLTNDYKHKHHNVVNRCINAKGHKFIKLVFDSKEKDLVTASSMMGYLDIGLEYFEELEARV